MKTVSGTQANKAYVKGKHSKKSDTSPYMGSKYLGLSNWWVKGHNETHGLK